MQPLECDVSGFVGQQCETWQANDDPDLINHVLALTASLAQRYGVKPVLNWANVCSPNILRTLRRTMIRFLIELLVRLIWFGQSKLYFVLNWLVMRCKLRPELAADAQQTADRKCRLKSSEVNIPSSSLTG